MVKFRPISWLMTKETLKANESPFPLPKKNVEFRAYVFRTFRVSYGFEKLSQENKHIQQFVNVP